MGHSGVVRPVLAVETGIEKAGQSLLRQGSHVHADALTDLGNTGKPGQDQRGAGPTKAGKDYAG